MFTIQESNSISLSVLRSPSTFGSQISLEFSGSDDPSRCINLYDTYFRFIVNVTNREDPLNNYIIIKNILSWFLSYDIHIQYNGSMKNYSNSALSNRGSVGNILQLFSNSYGHDQMIKQLNLISNGVTQNEDRFEVAVNLRYLFDIAQSSSWQSIKNISINMTMSDVKSIFSFDQNDVNATANISQIYLETNVVKFKNIPQELSIKEKMFFLPETSRIYTQAQSINVGDSVISLTITPPGKQMVLFYMFLQSNNTIYNTNANSSYVKNHSIQAMNGKIYPTQNNYQGLNRHYNDLIKNIQKWNPNSSSAITYNDFIQSNRIYSISTNDADMTSGSYSFYTELNQAFTVSCQIICFSIYYPHQKELILSSYE